MPDVLIGLLIVIVGGAMEGAFSFPVRMAGTHWRWENTWAAGSLAALVLVPFPLAFATVPQLGAVFAGCAWPTLFSTFLFGCGWGVGSIFFGLGVAELGMSVGLSLIMSLIAIGGLLVPLLIQRPEQFAKPAGVATLAGIAVMIAGISICAYAGHVRQKAAGSLEESSVPARRLRQGILYCVLSGVLSPMVNFALIFGGGIADSAIRYGATPANANNAIWALVFTANYSVNILYCLWLMRRNGTLKCYRAPGAGPNWTGAAAMGLLWAGGIAVYGAGATRMGPLGAFLGFPVMLTCSILTGNLIGALSGEWEGAPAQAKRTMTGGVVVLLAAISFLGFANALAG